MKCKNCGTTNLPGVLKCIECNVPLTGSMLITEDESINLNNGVVLCKNCKTENPASALKCNKCNAPLTGSLAIRPKKSKPGHNTQDISKPKSELSTKDCLACGYPNRSKADYCASCGEELFSPGEVSSNIENNNTTLQTEHLKENKFSMPINKNSTINPWISSTPNKKFILEILDANYQPTGQCLEFNEDEAYLNRLNLEQNNSTITQKTQAIISFKDDRWILNDESELKTTFIRPTKDNPLSDGDVILMGNRLFKFTANNG